METGSKKLLLDRKIIAAASAILLSLLITQARALPAKADTITVALQPSAMVGAQRIGSLLVSIREPISTSVPGGALVRMPLVTSNVRTDATTLLDVKASDADGPLALSFHDDAGGQEPYRHWTAARPVHAPLTITYRVPITNQPNPLGAAPPFELRSEGPAFSGLTGTFLLLPDNSQKYRLKLNWDFSALRGKTLGVSTLGLGDQATPAATQSQQLEVIFVMGGRLAHEPNIPAPDGFFSAWQGKPPFEARKLMQWTHHLYVYYLKFFHAKNATYTVYLRRNPINPGGGVEVQNSFVGTFGMQTRVDDFKITLAHEMVHTFVGALDAKDELAASWFAEGLAVYYERVLPWRAGLISRKSYLQDLNTTAARYYTDALNTTPNDQIAARFWPDTRVRVLPYDRGSLYFAQLNAEIRAASNGKRSLDDLLFTFLHRRAVGKPLTQKAWVNLVTRELGARGRQQFEDMMRGKLITLHSDTFGPCFRRVTVPLRRYQLGFTPDVLIEPKRIVRGLVPGSAAAKAGLHNGDEITEPVPQDAIQAAQHERLTLHIRRAGKLLKISYLPRGETVNAYQWVGMDAPHCEP